MSDQPKKAPRSTARKAGIVFLVILLILAGCFAALYFTITTDDVIIDDPAAVAIQTPMDASSRFVFDAASETAQICMDKSDLWWLLLPEVEDDLLENANRELEPYQLRLTGYGLNITEDGIFVDLEAMFKSVRLPVHILTAPDFDAAGFSLTLAEAKLGPFTLPAESLLSAVDLRMDVDWPVITDVTDVTYRQDAVVLTGTVTQELFSCVQKACQTNAIGWFSTNLQETFRIAGTADGFREVLPGLEADPGSVETLYHDLFVMALVQELEEYMTATRNLPQRFFPGIDFDALERESDSLRSQWVYYDVMVDKLVTQVSQDFNDRRFSIKNGEFYLKKSIFNPLNYFTGEDDQKMHQLFNLIDPEKFQLILVGSVNGYAADSPALNKVCDKKQELTQELNRKSAYPVGCVFQGINEEYFLRYESMKISGSGNQTSKWLKTVPLTETEYHSLVQEGKIGVWIS